jgi:hypothetical protein
MCPITDNRRAGQSARGQIRPVSRASPAGAEARKKRKMAEFGHFSRLARLLLS